MKVYIAGMTKRVRIRENIRPPMTTIPKEIRLVEPEPNAKAIGNAPSAVANEVIRIGRRREAEASKTASLMDNPCSLL